MYSLSHRMDLHLAQKQLSIIIDGSRLEATQRYSSAGQPNASLPAPDISNLQPERAANTVHKRVIVRNGA